MVGMSWEGFCLEQILNRMPRRWEAYFYRTQAGAEVDLVLTPRPADAPILVEFKHSHTPKPAKGFWTAKEDLQPKVSFIIYPGESAYPLAESVEVLGADMIEKIWSMDNRSDDNNVNGF
jgi:predicted AAA+ superfamily ATPase